MPLYDADFETANGVPDNAVQFKTLMIENDGLLIASPEHNGTISALLKNVIDWASRRVGDEPPFAAFSDKVAAIVSASPGDLGGLRGLMQLRYLLENMRVMVLPEQKTIARAHEAFAPDGSLNDKKTQEIIEGIGAKLAGMLTRLKT
jgi:NAD(P)H-dependent FMN reductase